MVKKINVGMVGYKFMGKAHSNAFRQVAVFYDPPHVPVLKALCGRDEDGVKNAAARYGWESYETSWKDLVRRDDIDLVDINTPNSSHAEIAIAAAENGKHVLLEKPMAMNLAEAKDMAEAVKRAGVKHMVGFNYRSFPALAFAKQIIREGKIGRVFHFRALYLQDWIVDPEFPLVWRLDRKVAGTGAIGYLGAHIIDIRLEDIYGIRLPWIGTVDNHGPEHVRDILRVPGTCTISDSEHGIPEIPEAREG